MVDAEETERAGGQERRALPFEQCLSPRRRITPQEHRGCGEERERRVDELGVGELLVPGTPEHLTPAPSQVEVHDVPRQGQLRIGVIAVG